MSLELSADDWIQNPALYKRKYIFKAYQCTSCGSEFSNPKISTEEAKLILQGRKNPRETFLIMMLCLLISEYSLILAFSVAVSIFVLKDIQRALVVSKNLRKGRCPHCLGHEYMRVR